VFVRVYVCVCLFVGEYVYVHVCLCVMCVASISPVESTSSNGFRRASPKRHVLLLAGNNEPVSTPV